MNTQHAQLDPEVDLTMILALIDGVLSSQIVPRFEFEWLRLANFTAWMLSSGMLSLHLYKQLFGRKQQDGFETGIYCHPSVGKARHLAMQWLS